MDSEELKPCPFCGGSSIVYENDCIYPRDYLWSIECDSCGARIQDDRKEEVLRIWNKRVELIK